ncbi:hypothetical protein [Streptomyces scabiei]|uniref:hypothetical protein n=1 Tax=Streptomyces scabiei TaxID=1930 RepID=UPI00298F6FF5|nr:hypothetical protein [Streptomyces scabiei]MDW8804613.1 hypothetical protein [Streptomyces scabiei]MDX2652307.1 hypothetical protein [Streptomyces scabiei]MDX2869074.1 hypothetical protein [Streptomyces scabiei]MDX2889668.1 hypothetical protein [Streptomyces scabiei]MDX2892020.1 hypothetical protein [Streptomyces scabiei]
MHYADNYRETRAHLLVHSARTGLHTIPQALADDYDALMQAIEDGQGGTGRWLSPEAEQRAEKLARPLWTIGPYGGTAGIITDHIAPAVRQTLDDLRAGLTATGPWGRQISPSLAMLELPDDTRAAIIQVHASCAAYGKLRGMWAELRGGGAHDRSMTPGTDPRGADSILGEVRNINDLVPAWRLAGTAGNEPWPWNSSDHSRLCWLIDNGAEFWTPTADQHDARWRALDHADREARRTTHARRPVGASGISAAA